MGRIKITKGKHRETRVRKEKGAQQNQLEKPEMGSTKSIAGLGKNRDRWKLRVRTLIVPGDGEKSVRKKKGGAGYGLGKRLAREGRQAERWGGG